MNEYFDWKKWVRRRDVVIGEFEDIWDANNRYEVAKGLLLALPEMEGISRKNKVEFLVNLVLAIREVDKTREKERLVSLGVNPEKIRENLLKPALRIFFEIVSVWDEELEKSCSCMLVNLMYIPQENLRGLEGKIKKFIHSYLNSVKKEEMDEYVIAKILIDNGMFEELVNYNFVFHEALVMLCGFVYKGCVYQYDPVYAFEKSFVEGCLDNPVFKKQLREMLLSWDKVENRHALATLWTLLAKRGDLEKIFVTEQAQK